MRIIDLAKTNMAEAYKEAAEALRAGKLVAYPTESFYAIGADAMNEGAVRAVFAAKKRGTGKPLPVILGNTGQIEKFTSTLSGGAIRAIKNLLPGPITLIFNASADVPFALTAGTGKIGIRVPKQGVASQLALAFGGAVTATSANISGLPGLTKTEDIAAFFPNVFIVLDGGATHGPPASTILDVTVNPPRLLREGALSKLIIRRVFPDMEP
ncbi:MAG: L-threonylcarbamoyladenylate synthase [Nitrospirota bacterium]